MPGQFRRKLDKPPPFPSPGELTSQQRKDAAEEVRGLRMLVVAALAKYGPSSGSSCSVVAEGFSQTAYEIVFAELRRAEWRVEWGSQRDRRGEFFISPVRRENPPTPRR
jgi:hypothetical protein